MTIAAVAALWNPACKKLTASDHFPPLLPIRGHWKWAEKAGSEIDRIDN